MYVANCRAVAARAMAHPVAGLWKSNVHPTTDIDPGNLLRRAGLRPTRQRLALATLLFANGDRHVTAEILHEEAVRAGQRVSLATVYNTLHQFKRAGLLREIAIGGQRAYFDTNTSNHNHYFIEDDGKLIDIPGDSIRVDGLPQPPENLRISHIDVVVRLVGK
jgi:Fur family iron response transcriptional regulator